MVLFLVEFVSRLMTRVLEFWTQLSFTVFVGRGGLLLCQTFRDASYQFCQIFLGEGSARLFSFVQPVEILCHDKQHDLLMKLINTIWFGCHQGLITNKKNSGFSLLDPALKFRHKDAFA